MALYYFKVHHHRRQNAVSKAAACEIIFSECQGRTHIHHVDKNATASEWECCSCFDDIYKKFFYNVMRFEHCITNPKVCCTVGETDLPKVPKVGLSCRFIFRCQPEHMHCSLVAVVSCQGEEICA